MLPKIMSKLSRYTKLSDSEYQNPPYSASDEDLPFLQTPREKDDFTSPASSTHRSRLCSALIVASASLTLGLLAFILVVAQRRHPQSAVSLWPTYQGGSVVVEHCGNSPQEAQDLGCTWDLMSFGWVHPRCFKPDESQMWLEKYGPWKWYYDLNATQEIAPEDLTTTGRVYTEQGYHVVHCLYIFKLLHMAGMSGHIVTDEAIPLAHTQHCVDMISSPKYTDFKHINTRVDMLFARCVTLN
ncbi:hypothetical protein COCC4DRAFT_65434 [Bipolaris maydis ATCC 48331]|uniref:Uncharacterized protein n=2 Tax=Cochliobolus heterostrophus TaxID=5016 RepID=M2TCZ1_COCH5|nr:uncharacterized protein COCC4DRAFT_65434 [Bipolaris maydis ATCC 48331]EMD95340.1 hypothetical protein COCHEDRAFT_1169074 [Bipolaris maydis C5]KAH7551084.1 hypothetical protein BM1_09958 [Bipolaris maydis]ENI00487.1 hypothetical protein COCC4DRAFT_65434 [Bipolaris maydis ATCC 48331]KAJ5021947.1 hypothetical protein J3E73DRAFT_240493 [Bipolaris maydis]KAJ5055117.1 hypothetical protein J3E74DRAFT_469237 [Bipolaris maydis]